MKIKQIKILGMHKVANKIYDLNEDITYFVGDNGVGKSTILEAIQLALLGYIPGYARTNESIMKHANAPMMQVSLVLEGDIEITRTWMRSGSSVTSSVDCKGIDKESIPDLIAEVELPIFNFNEFKSMTANKLKEWFIHFLPNSESNLDLKAKLIEGLGDRQILDQELTQTIDAVLEEHKDEDILSQIQCLNAQFKADQSYYKKATSKLQGTIESLIRYDDTDVEDEDENKEELSRLEVLKQDVIQQSAQKDLQDKLLAQVSEIECQLSAKSFSEDPKVAAIQKELEQLDAKVAQLSRDYSVIQTELAELEQKKRQIPSASATCPYTNSHCDEAAKLVSKYEAEIKKVDEEIEAKQAAAVSHGPSTWFEFDMKAQNYRKELADLENKYNQVAALKSQLTIDEVTPIDMPLDEINEKISLLQDKLVKIEANKRYDELTSTVTKDKFANENKLEVLKIWIKLTDANGLQTEVMNKPFETFADGMSEYLTKMFNQQTTAMFNLSNKANSFSFGLSRDNQYIEFDCLSSGEKCLFTLALIMCILNRSTAQIKTMLVDDILDHLDTSNATYLFDALKNVDDIQFILAGVKECADQSICTTV